MEFIKQIINDEEVKRSARHLLIAIVMAAITRTPWREAGESTSR